MRSIGQAGFVNHFGSQRRVAENDGQRLRAGRGRDLSRGIGDRQRRRGFEDDRPGGRIRETRKSPEQGPPDNPQPTATKGSDKPTEVEVVVGPRLEPGAGLRRSGWSLLHA